MTQAEETMKVTINNEQLQLAMKFRRFSQAQLGESVKLTQAAISKILNGITEEISNDLLRDLSEATGFPKSFFLQDFNSTTIGSSALYNRGCLLYTSPSPRDRG